MSLDAVVAAASMAGYVAIFCAWRLIEARFATGRR